MSGRSFAAVSGGGARGEGAEHGGELFHAFDADGLGDVEIETSVVGPAFVLFAGPAGYGDEDGIGVLGVFAQAADGLVAVHAGHVDIEQHHVGRELAGTVHRFVAAVGRTGIMAEQTDEAGERICGVAIVVHNQDALAHAMLPAHENFQAWRFARTVNRQMGLLNSSMKTGGGRRRK